MEWPSPSCPKKPSLDSFKSNLKICNFPKQQTCHVFPLHAATVHPCLLSVVGCKLCKVSILMRACACVCVYALRTVSLNKTLCYRNTYYYKITCCSVSRSVPPASSSSSDEGNSLLFFLLVFVGDGFFLFSWHGHKGETSLITDHDGDRCEANKSTQTKHWPERWAILSPQGHRHSFLTQHIFFNLCHKVTKIRS